MIEDAIDPRPPIDSIERWLDTCTLVHDVLSREPDLIARHWNDRETHWNNVRDLRHWIARTRR